MRKKAIFIGIGILVSNITIFPIYSGAEEPPAIENVVVTQWKHPTGESPITFAEWKKGRPTRPTHIEKKYPPPSIPSSPSNNVYVLVDPTIYSGIQTSLEQYTQDIVNAGYSVEIYSASFSTVQELRSFLSEATGLVGCILVGDFPVAWYEMDNPDPWGHEEFPIDIYYMDLDGTWTDADSDGIFDGHSGDIGLEIWMGRLLASNLTLGGSDEVALLNNYFSKNHAYRTGNLTLPHRALLYVDDDWAGWTDDLRNEMSPAYLDVTAVADEATTRAPDYKERLTHDYELIQLHAHSWSGGHAFKYPVDQWDYVYSADIEAIDPHAFFYNLFACSAARYVESDYIGGWYIFADTYGVAVVGSTKTGSMIYFDDFYGPFGQGKTWGESFKDWFNAHGESDPKWFYGMTLLGDPTVRSVAFNLSPIPTFPPDGWVTEDTEITFTWNPVSGAVNYRIQIDTVDTFDSPNLIEATVNATQYTATLSLGTWYWHVLAIDGEGNESPYSPTWHFTIAEPMVQATTDPADDWQPAITRTDDGKLWAVWHSRRDGNSDIWYKTSDDNGGTWSADTQLTTDPSSDYDPAIMQASDGTIWVVWYSYRSGNADIWYKTSTDGGATWSDAVQLTTDPNGDYSPAITQTSDGTIWVVWYSYRSGNADIWYKTSSDGGNTWSSAVQLTTAPEYDYRPAIAQTDDGTIWVLWDSWRTDHPGIWYKTSTNGGTSWSPDTEFSTDTSWDIAPTIAQTSDGTIWVARQSWSWDLWNWDIWYKTSSDGGATWSADQQFTRFTGGDEDPELAALPGDQVALVWSSDRAVNYDIWFGIIGVHGDVNPPPHLDSIEHDPRPNPDSNDTVTIRADVSDETGIASVTLKWWMDGTPQVDLTMYDDGAHDDYGPNDGWYGVQIGPFPVGTIVEYQAEVADVDGNTIIAPQYPESFEVIEPFVKTADILFVPDRHGDDTGWFAFYYTDALDALGYSYDVWDTGLRGAPDSATLNLYTDGAVIWGAPDWGYFSDSDTHTALENYLDAGGKLFISGQDIGFYAGGSTFYSDYLHATYVQDDTDLYGLNGVSGDSISEGLYLAISGGDGANNQYYPSEIDPIAPAVTIFTYDPSATTALAEPVLPEGVKARPEPGLEEPHPEGRRLKEASESSRLQGIVSSGTGAIRVNTGTYKVVYFAFGFEAINSASDRQLVMERVLDWMWSLFGDLDLNCVVDVADIQRVASRWRMVDTDPDWNRRYDLNGDGIITIVDIMLVAAHWGDTCD